MSDDEEDQIALNRNEKDQLRGMEENDTKVDKKEKRKKRLESRGIKLDDADADSQLSDEKESGSEEEEDEDGEKKKVVKMKDHAPLKKTTE